MTTQDTWTVLVTNYQLRPVLHGAGEPRNSVGHPPSTELSCFFFCLYSTGFLPVWLQSSQVTEMSTSTVPFLLKKDTCMCITFLL